MRSACLRSILRSGAAASECSSGAASTSSPLAHRRRPKSNFGTEYGAAVITKFIERAPGGGVRFRWTLSTWNPYRVVIMQTDFEP